VVPETQAGRKPCGLPELRQGLLNMPPGQPDIRWLTPAPKPLSWRLKRT